MKHEDYELIPFLEISEEARKIAVAWFEYKPMGFDLSNRHKLASDIMNYSNEQNKQLKVELSNYAFQIDRAKQERDKAENELMSVKAAIKKYCFHWDLYFNNKIVGNPPIIQDLKDLL